MEQYPTITDVHRNRFTREIKVKALKLPLKKLQLFLKTNIQHIYPFTKPQSFSSEYKSVPIKYTEDEIPEEIRQFLQENDGSIIDDIIQRVYKDVKNSDIIQSFNYNEVLKEILPSGVEIPQGYETIGQIAHFNLKPSQLQYKYIFGQVLLDKNRNLRTVVNKTEKLDNIYRTPTLELLAGVQDYSAIVPEGGCLFNLDFQKVYWCTRLYSERARVLKLIQPRETILDLFCGIGPFAIRAAANLYCNVIANDLNPECFKFLEKNIKSNCVQKFVHPLNMDARQVVNILFYKASNQIMYIFQLIVRVPDNFLQIDHVYMNLPVLAMDFLDIFRGFKRRCLKWPQDKKLPMIHVYGFIKGEENELTWLAEQRIVKALPYFKKESIENFQIIKNVTAKKKMVCISFRLSEGDGQLSDTEINELESLNQTIQQIYSDEEDMGEIVQITDEEVFDDLRQNEVKKKIKK